MIILDTCVLIFDALTPEKLSPVAKKAITKAEKKQQLFCSDISLWEIAMLVNKKRLDPGTDTKTFLHLALQFRKVQIVSISVEIADLSVSYLGYNHFDPADRIIAATTLHHDATLVTCDSKLQKIPDLSVIW